MEAGNLYLCATPIGNLEDISYRAVRILNEVDLVAAEDTRQTLKLFNHYEIKTAITSYHKFNIKQKTPYLITKLQEGLNIAVVSDAGLPGISDPGVELVTAAIENSINVIPIPGPSALTTALVASGLNTNSFSFYGFIPSKKSGRKKFLDKLIQEEKTLIFYESPHRIIDTLEIMYDLFGERKVCVSRELTKKFEEFRRGSFIDLINYYKQAGIKGEITLVVSGADTNNTDDKVEISQLLSKVDELIRNGIPKKEALKTVAKDYNVPKRELYQMYENNIAPSP